MRLVIFLLGTKTFLKRISYNCSHHAYSSYKPTLHFKALHTCSSARQLKTIVEHFLFDLDNLPHSSYNNLFLDRNIDRAIAYYYYGINFRSEYL